MNYELRIKNIIKNKRGTALFLALMILSGALIASLGAASLIVSSVKQAQTQVYSTNAYYAAEAGAERVLWEIRKNGANLDSCNIDDYINFDNDNIPPLLSSVVCGSEQLNSLSNGASYSVQFKSGGTATTTVSRGIFKDTARMIEVSY